MGLVCPNFEKIKCLSPESGRVNFIFWIKTYRNRQISSRAIRRYQKNEIGSVVVKNESPKVGQISGKHDRKIYYMMHDYVELLKIPEVFITSFRSFNIRKFTQKYVKSRDLEE